MMKPKLKTAIVLLSILSTLPAFAQGTHARFDTETGTSEGQGTLHSVPFTWKASQPIEKILDNGRAMRTNNFNGGTVTFSFESPVKIETVQLSSVNGSSKNKMTFYAADETVIAPQDVEFHSVDGSIVFPCKIEDDSIIFRGAKRTGPDDALINFLPAISGVSKIVFEVQNEAGLLDIRIKGSSSR
jgi:hypothetical protein